MIFNSNHNKNSSFFAVIRKIWEEVSEEKKRKKRESSL